MGKWIAGVALALFAATAVGEDAARLTASDAFYKAMTEGSCTFAVQVELPQAGFRNRTVQEMHMRRPNQLLMRTTEGRQGGGVQSDGKQLFLSIPDLKRYTAEPAPDSFETWIKKQQVMPTPGGDVVLQLLGGSVLQSLGASLKDVKFVATEDVEGHTCDKFEVKTPQRRVQFWVGKDDPWLWRLRSEAPNARIDIVFSDWKPTVASEVDFATKPSADLKLSKTLFPQQQRRAPRRTGARPAGGPGVGDDAIAFEADLLVGGDLKLADHLGKNVIVLDFWATWCKPCLMGLPIVAEETAKRKADGVVFYAVNLRESEKKVKAMMDAKSWTFPVALDRDGRVGTRYGARSIPHTVIIGKDGKVANVHVGFSPSLRQQIAAELDALTKK